MEAKIYLGNSLVASIATETIENAVDYQDKKYTEKSIRQACESKVFTRLAGKIKRNLPRL